MSELKHVYCRSTIFRQAWVAAKHDAAVHGGRARHYLAEALRQAWGRVKATREMRARVLAAVEEIRFQQSEIGRARHERARAAFMAQLDAHMAALRARQPHAPRRAVA